MGTRSGRYLPLEIQWQRGQLQRPLWGISTYASALKTVPPRLQTRPLRRAPGRPRHHIPPTAGRSARGNTLRYECPRNLEPADEPLTHNPSRNMLLVEV